MQKEWNHVKQLSSKHYDQMKIKSKVEKILSEILSDKHDANITLRFVKVEDDKEDTKQASWYWGGGIVPASLFSYSSVI